MFEFNLRQFLEVRFLLLFSLLLVHPPHLDRLGFRRLFALLSRELL
jgi:hypothetical protein